MHRNKIKTRSRWWINCFGEQGWRSIKKEVTSDLSFSLVLTLIRGFFSRSEGFSLSTTSTLWIPIRHGNIRQESYLVECPLLYLIIIIIIIIVIIIIIIIIDIIIITMFLAAQVKFASPPKIPIHGYLSSARLVATSN